MGETLRFKIICDRDAVQIFQQNLKFYITFSQITDIKTILKICFQEIFQGPSQDNLEMFHERLHIHDHIA